MTEAARQIEGVAETGAPPPEPTEQGAAGERPPLQRKSSSEDFRDAIGKGLSKVRRNMVVVAVYSVLINVLVLAIPIYLFNLSDRVLTSRSVDTLIMLSAIVLLAILANVLLDAVRRVILMRTAVEIERRLGGPVLAAAAKAAQTGSTREFQILGDLQAIRNFIIGPTILLMFDAPIGPVFLLAVFLVHPHLGFITVGAAAILIVVALVNRKITEASFKLATHYAARANQAAESMSHNAMVINAMGMIPEGVAIWGRETAQSLCAQVTAQDRNIAMSTISKFVRMTMQIAILGWGAELALGGELTGGMVIAGSIVAARALGPIEGTIEGWRGYVHARQAYARITQLIVNSPLAQDKLRLPSPQGRLHVERVLFVPPMSKKVILNGISFSLEPGESLAVIGSSGVGKSTLGKMLVGSITPTAGNIRLDLMDLRNWDPRQFGESIGYLPQDVQLFPATIKENIARMRADAEDAEVYEAAQLADVHDVIAAFPQGYETVIAGDGAPLSGGQKQRIGLARAFYGRPRFVVLDEPNSNLDTSGEAALGRAMARAKAQSITVVAITQRPALLASVDKILILKDGSVQAFGPRDEIVQLLQRGNS